jgi:hypothetical protein
MAILLAKLLLTLLKNFSEGDLIISAILVRLQNYRISQMLSLHLTLNTVVTANFIQLSNLFI